MDEPNSDRPEPRVSDDFFQGNVERGLERMRLRLLDLTNRNRLLNFRHTKRSTLDLLGHPPELLYDQLRDGAEITFKPVPKPPRDGRPITAGAYAEQLGLPTELDLPPHTPSTEQPDPIRAVQALFFPEELESILRHIAGAARLSIEETGVNMLYLIFGFLEWYDSDDSERPALAPLVLLPATLERGEPDPDTRTYRYVLRHSGEDIVGNVSLQERLRRDFSLALPDFSEDTDLGTYFADLVPLPRGQRRWSIRRRVTLGLASFQKLLMYRDLDPHAWTPGTGPIHHPRVREFFEGIAHEGFSVASDYELDSADLRSKVPPLIYDADSSQHSALVDALAGKNLVIQGPPGTGKSQTITNLIAAAIAAGKTVLFVAEKLAALEVVKRRLDAARLGAFCLELHSHKARKRDVLDNLQARLDQGFSDAAGLDYQLQQLERRREELNRYAATISQLVGRSGYTVYEVLWAFSRRRADLTHEAGLLEHARLDHAATLTPADLGNIRHVLETLSTLADSIRSTWGMIYGHPWAGFGAHIVSFDEERAILGATGSVAASADTLIADRARLPVSADVHTAAALIAVASAAERLRPPQEPFYPVLLERLPTHRPAILAFLETLEAFRRAASELDGVVSAPHSLDAPRVGILSESAERLSRAAVPAVTLNELRRHISTLHDWLAAIDDVRDIVEAYRREFACDSPFTAETLGMIEVTSDLLQEAPKHALSLRHPALSEPGAVHMAAAAQEDLARLHEQRARLDSVLTLSLAPDRDEVRRHARAVAAAGPFALLRADYRAARRGFLAMRKDGLPTRRAVLRQVYRDLLDHADAMAVFQSNAEYRRIAGPHYQATRTDFGTLWTAAAWKERLDGELLPFGEMGRQLAAAIWRAAPEQIERVAALPLPHVASRLANHSPASSVFHGAPELTPSAPLDDLYGATRALIGRYEADLAALDRDGFSAALTVAQLPDVLGRLRDLIRFSAAAASASTARELLGADFRGPDTPVEALRETLRVYDAVISSALGLELRAWLLDAAHEERRRYLASWAAEVRNHAADFARSVETLEQVAAIDPHVWLRAAETLQTTSLDRTAARAREALHHRHELQRWAQYAQLSQELRARGLARLVTALQDAELSADRVADAFDLVYFQSLAEAALTEHPLLARFDGLTHEQVRRRFAELDSDVMEMHQARIAHQASRRSAPSGVETGPVSGFNEAGLLKHEIRKQRRHIPLRQLVARAPRALQALKPCFMMSPLSVAQYLAPASISFDIVVMDEASQLKPEDALGAVVRGAQLVVVGDPMQLPPTSFFERLDDEEDEPDDSAAALADSESILDVASMLYAPDRLLKWHYRSQHGSLIAFSNAEFYANRLIVFPSPVASSSELGIQFVPVANAVYHAGTNVEEAGRVIDGVLEHMRLRPGESLGVVALNLRQRDVLEDEFERRFKEDVFAQGFVERHRNSAEPFFIKNLENVQGDERDIIMISVTYGPDRAGNVFQRFGLIHYQRTDRGHRFPRRPGSEGLPGLRPDRDAARDTLHRARAGL
jgi:hypothetical protein